MLAAASELDYRPSHAGRALVSGLSDIVIVIVPNVTFGPGLQDSVDRITQATSLAKLSVVLRFAGFEDESALSSVLDVRPIAIVDLGVFNESQRSRIRKLGTRIIPSVPPSDEEGEDEGLDIWIGRLQAREILRNGSRRLVYAGLADKRLDPFGPYRLEGVRREARERGVEDPLEIRVPLSAERAADILAETLATTGTHAIGVCCYKDEVALAVIAAARRLGRRIPEDISVIGVDNTEVGQLVSPRLTSVEIDLAQLIEAVILELGDLRSPKPRIGNFHASHPPADLARLVSGQTT